VEEQFESDLSYRSCVIMLHQIFLKSKCYTFATPKIEIDDIH